jgi:hypothetical protein
MTDYTAHRCEGGGTAESMVCRAAWQSWGALYAKPTIHHGYVTIIQIEVTRTTHSWCINDGVVEGHQRLGDM